MEYTFWKSFFCYMRVCSNVDFWGLRRINWLWPCKITDLPSLWIYLYSLNRGQIEKGIFSFFFVHVRGGRFIFILFLFFHTHILHRNNTLSYVYTCSGFFYVVASWSMCLKQVHGEGCESLSCAWQKHTNNGGQRMKTFGRLGVFVPWNLIYTSDSWWAGSGMRVGGEQINTSASWHWGKPRGWGTRQGKDSRSVLTACRWITVPKSDWLDR